MADTTEVAHIIPDTLCVCVGGGGGGGLFVPLLPLLTLQFHEVERDTTKS